MNKKILGLIAGNGQFPILFAQKAKSQNYQVIAAGIHGDTSLLMKIFSDKFSMFKVGELERLFSYFKREGVDQVVMAGQVNPDNLFDKRVSLDLTFQKLFNALQDRKADTIFAAVADHLKEQGMVLLDSTFLLQDSLAPRGTLTKRGPSLDELADIEFGRTIAKMMGGIDIGQTVVIKGKAIVAIEAMEGTDRTIARGGEIAQDGAVIVKMSKPNQDLRFDVPVVGPKTIQAMRKSKAKCLAIEAGKTIIIDQKDFLKTADKAGICVVGA